MSPTTVLAALAAAWMPGRIAVRFDAELAGALMDTSLEATIPVEVLQRIPALGLYIDTPDLGAGTGIFVALDAGRWEAPGKPAALETDELMVAVVRDDPVPPRLMLTSIWLLPGASIVDSVAAQARQTAEHGTGVLGSDELRWVPPVPVKADLSDKMLTVVRPAGDPGEAPPA